MFGAEDKLETVAALCECFANDWSGDSPDSWTKLPDLKTAASVWGCEDPRYLKLRSCTGIGNATTADQAIALIHAMDPVKRTYFF